MKLDLKMVLQNGVTLIIPPLLITFGLWKWLPVPYSQENFSRSAPQYLEFIEDGLRIVIFVMPLFLVWGLQHESQRIGLTIYAVGILLYALSYLAQILYPDSSWSSTAVGFTAPAWTTAFWLLGIGLICKESWLFSGWKGYIYISVAMVFVIIHTYHAYLAHVSLNNPIGLN